MIKEIPYASHGEWLQIRRGYIGGSEAGAVLGLDDYASPYSVWAEKTGRTPGFEGNVTTRVGIYLEELVARMWCEDTGKKVRRKNRVLVNEDYPFACADVDRLVVGERAGLEIKTTNSFPVMKSLRGGDFPARWYCQCVHYLAVTGLERWYLAVLVNCRELQTFTLERDEEEIAALMQAERAFWDGHVKADVPPAPDGHEATTETISTIYRESGGGSVELFGRAGLLQEYEALRGQKKALDGRMAEIENVIKTDMKDAERGECDGWRVSWKSQTRRTFDAKKFTAAHRELEPVLAGYYKEITTRPFKVTAI